MASKYRIGTTVGVKMVVDNMPTGSTLKMYARCEYGTYEMNNVVVDVDPQGIPISISGKFAGADQKFTGKYDILLVSSTKRRLCVDDAFELVSHSYSEGDLESEQTEVTLNFSVAFLTNATNVSGYEEWRVDHDGTIEDYWAFIRDEARLQQIETNVQANADAIVAERERAAEAEKTLQENIEAETKAREEADDGLVQAISQESILREQADEKEAELREQAIAQEADAREVADQALKDDLYRNTPTEIGLDEDTGEVYAIFPEASTVSRTYIAKDCELTAEIDEVGVNDDGELWSDIVVN
ncbi:MAG: hypothetical protein ACI3YT_10380 [Prevotella sp.]